MSTIDASDLAQIQQGTRIGRPADDYQRIWLDLFDSLFAEDYEELERYQRYYDGEQNIKWNDGRFKEVFGQEFTGVRDNWCEVVVDACADRLHLEGFTVTRLDHQDTDTENPEDGAGQVALPGADPTTQVERAAIPAPGEFERENDPLLEVLQHKLEAIWNRNKLGSMQHRIHVGSMVKKRSFLMVWPDSKDARVARIWFNDASLIRVWYDEDGLIEAASKRWERPDGVTRQNLYFRDRVEKWLLEDISSSVNLDRNRRPSPGGSTTNHWQWVTFADDDDETWPLENPYNRVPIFPFINKPHSSLEGLSEIATVITQQDAINMAIAEGMVASQYSAFMQKIMASKGRPKEGWKHGPNMLWSTTDTDARWGQFDATPMENFVTWIDMLVNHVSGTSRTPQYMFFVTGQIPSGESLKTVDSGLVNKGKRKSLDLGDSWTEAVRFALEIELGADSFPDDVMLEANWGPIETRIDSTFWETQRVKGQVGVSTRQLLREGGYSDPDIAEFEQEKADQQQQTIADSLLRSFTSGIGAGGDQPPVLPTGPAGTNNPEPRR